MENKHEGNQAAATVFANGSSSRKKVVAPRLLDVGIELGYLSHMQAEATYQRHRELLSSGIDLPLGQVLLERRILAPGQLKALMHEIEYRRANRLQSRSTSAAELVNRRFGPFQLLEVLSENGRSRVFKARDVSMNRMVVLKVLPSDMAADAHWLERFRRELVVAGQLVHPNIVTAYGAGEICGCPYMALEYVRGSSLAERLEREGNFPEKTAWLVAREVAKALHYAAQHGILHRDIKPANILCGVSGSIKICDLGLSKSNAETSQLTQVGMAVGTPLYMSPEQVRGASEIDHRADIYSLGCTVFHMLTGAVPFVRKGVISVMRAQAEDPRPDPRSLLPEISEASAILVMRMMAIRPGDRPFDAEALLTEIDAILPSLPEPEETERPLPLVTPADTARPARTRVPAPRSVKEATWLESVRDCWRWVVSW